MLFNNAIVKMNNGLKLYAYKLLIFQEIKLDDNPLCEQIAVHILKHMDEDDHFLLGVVFSGEVTFHFRKVYRTIAEFGDLRICMFFIALNSVSGVHSLATK